MTYTFGRHRTLGSAAIPKLKLAEPEIMLVAFPSSRTLRCRPRIEQPPPLTQIRGARHGEAGIGSLQRNRADHI